MASEIEAMSLIEKTVEALDEAQRMRVLHWTMSRFNVHPNAKVPHVALREEGGSVGEGTYATFAELFDAAQPSVERDKALVAAYWVQVCTGEQSFQAQILNNLLKDLGHGVGNITEALTQLKNDRPALMLQLKKSGLSQQARKTYKLTEEGSRRVRRMISKEDL